VKRLPMLTASGIIDVKHGASMVLSSITVERLAKKLMPDARQRQVIDEKLALLKTRLEAVGH
jgi:hypothetical protein